jgi:NADPH:quinone reductase-like Zn-dependent oxidoreductase
VIGVQPEISAAFAQRMVAPARNVVPLPPGTPADVGSLVEPLAVGYHGVRRAGATGEDTVLVIGGGPIGQAAALAARRLGATTGRSWSRTMGGHPGRPRRVIDPRPPDWRLRVLDLGGKPDPRGRVDARRPGRRRAAALLRPAEPRPRPFRWYQRY